DRDLEPPGGGGDTPPARADRRGDGPAAYAHLRPVPGSGHGYGMACRQWAIKPEREGVLVPSSGLETPDRADSLMNGLDNLSGGEPGSLVGRSSSVRVKDVPCAPAIW